MRLTFYKRQWHDFIYTTRENIITRRYPWGIQRSVSTYSNHHVMNKGWGGVGPRQDALPSAQAGPALPNPPAGIPLDADPPVLTSSDSHCSSAHPTGKHSCLKPVFRLILGGFFTTLDPKDYFVWDDLQPMQDELQPLWHQSEPNPSSRGWQQ